MQRDLEFINIFVPFGSLGGLLRSLLLCLLVGVSRSGLRFAIDALSRRIELEGNRLGSQVFVEGRLLVLHLVDAASCDLPEAATFLEMLDEAKTAFGDQKCVVPPISLGQLKWIGEIVSENVPSVSDDANKLQPRLGGLGVLSGPCHHLKQLCHPLNAVINFHNVLLVVLFVSLLKLDLFESLGVLVLFKSLLELLEVQLKNIVEDAALTGNLQLRSL